MFFEFFEVERVEWITSCLLMYFIAITGVLIFLCFGCMARRKRW
jgi:hypothetical protein